MTLTEKLLARASGLDEVAAGDVVTASINLAVCNEDAAIVSQSFQDLGGSRVWDSNRLVIVFDHHVPANSGKSAEAHRVVREFVHQQGIRKFYDVGRGGISYQVLKENCHVLPGMVVVGTDSHSGATGAFGAFATHIETAEMAKAWAEGRLQFRVPRTIRVDVYGSLRQWVSAKDLILYVIGRFGVGGAKGRALEFDGPVIRQLSVPSRIVLATLSMETGARAALTPVDDILLAYLARRTGRTFLFTDSVVPDVDAKYEQVLKIDAEREVREPLVACPHSVDNVQPVSSLDEIPVDQAVLGSCANGRLEDLEVAAELVKGRRIHPRTRLLVIPASQQVYADAVRFGYMQMLVSAGAVVSPPKCYCSPGASFGNLAAGEVCISSTNQNSAGCMGSKRSEVYLASPAVVAASALAGRIVHPDTVLESSVA